MTIARIENGAVAELRNIELADVPVHKRDQWLTVEGEAPSYNGELEYLIGPEPQIEETRVLRVWTVERKSIEEQREAVIRERARRLAAGFDYDFGDGRGVHRIGTTDSDMIGWDEVSKYASALIASGSTSTGISIVTNTGPTQVTAQEWQSILIAAGQFRQPIWQGSFVLQAMEEVPADYASNDAYWTA